MQAFTPLTGSGRATVSSEFYLAQIDAVHAGKTIEIHLWDPGDTNPLNAKLQILDPDQRTPGRRRTSRYTATQGTSNSGRAACGTLTGTGVTQVETNVGATTGTFNGCWLIHARRHPRRLHARRRRLVEDPLQHDRDRARRTTSRPGR